MAETLRWRSHPVADDYPRSLLLVALVVAISVGVWISFDGIGYALLTAGLLVGSLARYFAPTWYVGDEAGVSVRFLGWNRVVRWGDVRRVLAHRDGVFLSPFERPSRLDAYRGMFLRFAGNADEVVSFVERQVAAHRQA